MADGAISWLCPPRYLHEVAVPALRIGAEKAGRPVPPLVAHVLLAPSSNSHELRASAREILAYYQLRPFYRKMFAAAGYPTEPGQPAPDALIDALVISGDSEALADGLRQRLDEGFDELVISIVSGNDARAAEDAVLGMISQL
jgi:alkanesulfonate monooxygenase SsuD/methylene tetrahydromethanopterin reductase-like flavin-dependent oxidoreductase (luciferase family)